MIMDIIKQVQEVLHEDVDHLKGKVNLILEALQALRIDASLHFVTLV